MQETLRTIDIPQVRKLLSLEDDYSIGDDFIMGKVEGSSVSSDSRILEFLSYPIRFDGYIIFFLRKGQITMDFNVNSYEIQEKSMIVSVPGNIFKLPYSSKDDLNGIELIFVLISRDFLSGLHIDFKLFFHESIKALDNPCIKLDDTQAELVLDFFILARNIIVTDMKNKRSIVGSLLSSLSYFTGDLWQEQISNTPVRYPDAGAPRLNQLKDRFFSLLNEFHTSERSVKFYADRLCLTPKYLSKVIRSATGKSAPEWIDSYVILEAQNLLRHSEMSIKEIVFSLNFRNQSAFHKFFKSHTGHTPSEYRKLSR